MDLTGLIVFLLIGALGGWLASNVMIDGSFGLLGNTIIGVIGSVIGGLLFGLVDLSIGSLIGSAITATIGTALLLFIVTLVKKT